MFIIIVLWLGRDRMFGLPFFMPTLLFFHTHASLLTFFCYIILFHTCCTHERVFGKHSCMSSPFPIAYWMVPYFLTKRHDRNGQRVAASFVLSGLVLKSVIHSLLQGVYRPIVYPSGLFFCSCFTFYTHSFLTFCFCVLFNYCFSHVQVWQNTCAWVSHLHFLQPYWKALVFHESNTALASADASPIKGESNYHYLTSWRHIIPQRCQVMTVRFDSIGEASVKAITISICKIKVPFSMAVGNV